MDTMDPFDSIPFADDDEDDHTTIATTTSPISPSAIPTPPAITTIKTTTSFPQDPAPIMDAGDSLNCSQKADLFVPVAVGDAADFVEIATEKKEVHALPGAYEHLGEESVEDVTGTMERESGEGDADAQQGKSVDQTREKSDGGRPETIMISKVYDAPCNEASIDSSKDVDSVTRQASVEKTGDDDVTQQEADALQTPDVIRQVSDDVTDKQTPDVIQLTSEEVSDSPTHDIQKTADDVTESQAPQIVEQTSDEVIDSQAYDVIQQTEEEERKEEKGMVAEDGDLSEEQREDVAPGVIEDTQADTAVPGEGPKNDLFVSSGEEDRAPAGQDAPHIETGSHSADLSGTMDLQGETHGGKTAAGISDDLVDDFFGTTSTSETVTNGYEDECILRIDEAADSAGKDVSSSRPALEKEGSPEIVVGSMDSVEDVTLKDATSEKALIGSGEEEGSVGQRDSLSSRTDEDKQKSSSDMDMDFAVLEVDSSRLNLDPNKQKTSLCKKGSLCRRKKPTRATVSPKVSESSDTMFQDCTDAKPLTSSSFETAEDEVFDKQTQGEELQETKSTTFTVRKAAQPFKPSLMMPGLQELRKSKLFNQEKKSDKSEEESTSTLPTSSQSPSHQPAPPQVLPKPTSKVQKDSQNKTIAAEKTAQSSDFNDSRISHSVATSSVDEVPEIPKDTRSDSTSSSEGPAQGDGGSLTGPRYTRTDSWSSVSSPRVVNRRESTSSVEGGEVGSAQSTPRRASIQGVAYSPMGFRPRRSSSIALDSNNKLVDLAAPLSPSPSSPAEPEASSGVKSPISTPPAWLSEMKAKTGVTSDSGARFRSTSVGSNDSSAVSASSGRSRNSSGSADGAQGQNVADDVTQKRQDELEPERPSWMKAAEQRTLVTATVSSKRDVEENGDEERPVPPWAAELKKRNRPFISSRISETAGDSVGRMATAPYRGGDKKEEAPVVNSAEISPDDGRDDYSPSWRKSSQPSKKPPPPAVPSKPTATNKPAVAPKTQSQNPMKQYEIPKWKLELAEKKKKREAEMMPVAESSLESGSSSSASASANGSIPQWRQQLRHCKKPQGPEGLKESGLFDQENTMEES